LLCKADLVSEMVGEFPELQGTMGYYYALNEGLPEAVALAIKEHYLPRFAGDAIPTTLLGCAVSLADRIDKLVGIFGIGGAPSGDKDPFALRRQAVSALRMCIEKALPLDLEQPLQAALLAYKGFVTHPTLLTDLKNFLNERLRAWYQD